MMESLEVWSSSGQPLTFQCGAINKREDLLHSDGAYRENERYAVFTDLRILAVIFHCSFQILPRVDTTWKEISKSDHYRVFRLLHEL